MYEYFEEIFSNFDIKAILAVIASFYTNYMAGEISLLIIYLGFNFLDLFLGTYRAIKEGRFSSTRFGQWTQKFLTHMLIIVMSGLLNYSVNTATDFRIPLLDFFLVLLIATEGISAINHMLLLSWPVPKIAVTIFQHTKKDAENKIHKHLNIGREGEENETDKQDNPTLRGD